MSVSDLGDLGPCVVLCPPLAPQALRPTWHDPLLARLAQEGIPVIAPAPPRADDPGGTDPGPADPRLELAAWVGALAVAITGAGLDRPLILVAAGEATRGLPALGFSQRASRHHVVGYVLVDGPAPPAGPATRDWPDAPVLCVLAGVPGTQQELASGARLRGWSVRHGDPVEAVCALVRRWPDGPA